MTAIIDILPVKFWIVVETRLSRLTLFLESGASGRAAVPSGASTGA